MGSLFNVDGTTGNLTTAGSITSTSTTSGFQLPTMTTTQRNAIPTPATGLEIFNTTTNQSEFWNGSAWVAVGGSGGSSITALTGDVTATGPGSVAATLATVNSSPGSTTISSVTTNAKGLVTANSSATTTGSGNVVLASSPSLTTPALGTPSALVLTNATGTPSSIGLANGTGLSLTTGVSGILPIANGGTNTSSPSLVAGTNVTITGSWPNQTVNASGGGTQVLPQVIQNSLATSQIDLNNNTPTAVGPSQAITLQKSTNKVKVTMTIDPDIAANAQLVINFYKDGTIISGTQFIYGASSGASHTSWIVQPFIINAPGDTSSHTYSIKGFNASNSADIFLQSTTTYILLEEILS